MTGDYDITDPTATDHYLQMGHAGDSVDGNRLQGRAEHRPAMFGYCAFCGWKVGGMDSPRSVRRAYERHVKAARKGQA